MPKLKTNWDAIRLMKLRILTSLRRKYVRYARGWVVISKNDLKKKVRKWSIAEKIVQFISAPKCWG